MNLKTDRKSLSQIVAVAMVALFIPRVFAAPAPVSEMVFEQPLHNEDLAAHFDVNRNLGRAWIDVELSERNNFEYTEPEVIPRAVDGLYYDQARKQVIYRNGTGGIVCAEDSTFLWTTSLKATGQCQLKVISQDRKVDDGFHYGEETVGQVVFEVRQAQ